MSPDASRPRRRRFIVPMLVLLAVLGGGTALAVWAFHLGTVAGFAAAAGCLIVYSVPATIFDWPRLSWSDLVGAVLGIVAAILGAVAALFD